MPGSEYGVIPFEADAIITWLETYLDENLPGMISVAGWTYTASDVQLAIDESVYTEGGESYVKKSEITPPSDIYDAELRVKVDIKTSSDIRPMYAIIYKNGVALSSQQSTTSESYVTKTWDLGPFETGDTIELWIRTGDGVGTCYATNFEICGDVDTYLYSSGRTWSF